MTPPTTSQALVKRSQDHELMPPPPPPKRIKRPAQVLDEDEYTDALSHIIARDYFPGLLETEAKQDYLDALQSKDEAWIARAGRQLEEVMTPGPKSRARRGVSMTPRVDRPADTPLATPKGWTGDTPVSLAGSETPSSIAQDSKSQKRPDITNMSLGAFQAKYTSEDNESFNKLLDKQNEKRRGRYAWLWNDNKIPTSRQIAHRKREAKLIEAQAAESSSNKDKQLIKTDLDARPAKPDAWKAKPRNALMFGPDSIEDTHETIQRKAETESRAGPKQVLYHNTRLQPHIEDAPDRPPSPTASEIRDAIAGRPRRSESEAGLLGAETPRVNGYAFVDEDEPEPAPEGGHDHDYHMKLLTSEGVDATPSPFIIRDNRKREELHHRMVDRVARSKRTERISRETKTPVPKFPSSPMIAFGRTPGGGGAAGTRLGSLASGLSSSRSNIDKSSSSSSSSKTALTPAAQRLWERVGMTPRASIPSKSSSDLKNMWTPVSKRKR
ncbi:hypothetical protein KEM56_006245 [Ascosphaera pollenicola]|nr:hypothetical protein KEM56_006245 [Ascosphaera pollenicola]